LLFLNRKRWTSCCRI